MGERDEHADELRVHELFASLRAHVVEVTGDLVERVHDELEELAVTQTMKPVSVGSTLLKAGVEATNLIMGLLGRRKAPRPEQEEEPEP